LIVETFSGIEKNVAKMMIFNSFNGFKKNSEISENTLYIILATVLVVAIGMIVIVIYCGNSVVPAAMSLWAVVFIVGLAEQIFLTEMLIIWWQWVVVFGDFIRKCDDICGQLRAKSKLILIRTTGIVTKAPMQLIQHFNPACRLARVFPAFPLSRVLLSLNDFDLSRPVSSNHLGTLLLLPLRNFFMLIVLCPDALRLFLLSIFSTAALNGFGIMLYLVAYYSQSEILVILIFVAIIVFPTVYETVQYLHTKRAAAVYLESKRNIELFSLSETIPHKFKDISDWEPSKDNSDKDQLQQQSKDRETSDFEIFSTRIDSFYGEEKVDEIALQPEVSLDIFNPPTVSQLQRVVPGPPISWSKARGGKLARKVSREAEDALVHKILHNSGVAVPVSEDKRQNIVQVELPGGEQNVMIPEGQELNEISRHSGQAVENGSMNELMEGSAEVLLNNTENQIRMVSWTNEHMDVTDLGSDEFHIDFSSFKMRDPDSDDNKSIYSGDGFNDKNNSNSTNHNKPQSPQKLERIRYRNKKMVSGVPYSPGRDRQLLVKIGNGSPQRMLQWRRRMKTRIVGLSTQSSNVNVINSSPVSKNHVKRYVGPGAIAKTSNALDPRLAITIAPKAVNDKHTDNVVLSEEGNSEFKFKVSNHVDGVEQLGMNAFTTEQLLTIGRQNPNSKRMKSSGPGKVLFQEKRGASLVVADNQFPLFKF